MKLLKSIPSSTDTVRSVIVTSIRGFTGAVIARRLDDNNLSRLFQ
jgi:hypothetical protein